MSLFFLLVLACFIIFRLWSVLGKRPENKTFEKKGNLIFLNKDQVHIEKEQTEIEAFYPGFEESHFLKGAEKIFSMIIEAYHKGDMTPVKPFITADFFETLSRKEDTDRGKLEKFRLISASISEKSLRKKRASITVHFVSYQIFPTQRGEVDDWWIFERGIRDKSPNWQLVDFA